MRVTTDKELDRVRGYVFNRIRKTPWCHYFDDALSETLLNIVKYPTLKSPRLAYAHAMRTLVGNLTAKTVQVKQAILHAHNPYEEALEAHANPTPDLSLDLESLLNRFDDSDLFLITQYFIFGFSSCEISNDSSMNQPTVSKKIERIRKKFKKLLHTD